MDDNLKLALYIGIPIFLLMLLFTILMIIGYENNKKDKKKKEDAKITTSFCFYDDDCDNNNCNYLDLGPNVPKMIGVCGCEKDKDCEPNKCGTLKTNNCVGKESNPLNNAVCNYINQTKQCRSDQECVDIHIPGKGNKTKVISCEVSSPHHSSYY